MRQAQPPTNGVAALDTRVPLAAGAGGQSLPLAESLSRNVAAAGAGSLGATYVPGIDGLRAIAVLSVILFHFSPGLLPGGYSGVDVFFVVSGYVVSKSLAADPQQSFSRFTLAFYARRILRIYPALVACLLVAGIAQTLFIPESWLSTTSSKTGILAFFGLSNFALTALDDGYFSPRTEFNTFTHTWSLAVEEQFYIVFPALMFAWLAWRRNVGLAGVIARWTLPAALGISLVVCWYQTQHAPDHAYYWIFARFWELACGAMLFRLHSEGRFLATSALQKSSAILAGIVLVILGFLFSDPEAFPFPWAAFPVLGTLSLIAGVNTSAGTPHGVVRILDNAVMVYIGKLSYSLYLWHWPVVVLFRWTVGLDRWATVVPAAAIIVLASVLSYHLIERPIGRFKAARAMTDGSIVRRGMIAIAIAAMAVTVIFKAQPYLSLSVTKDRESWYPESWPGRLGISNGAPDFKGRTLFVLGDSHAAAYSTMLQMLADQHGAVVRTYSKGGCSVAGLLEGSSPDCAASTRDALRRVVAQASPGDVVFLASLRVNRLSDQWTSFDEAEVARQAGSQSAARRATAFNEADSVVDTLEQAGLTVVMDAPMPVFSAPAFRCADWFNRHNPVCKGGGNISREWLLGHRSVTMTAIGRLASRHPNLIVWDPFPVLCPREVCTAIDGSLPLFFDGDHLSAHGNRVLYPSFVSVLERAWSPTRTETKPART